MLRMSDVSLDDQRVLIRHDLNVPIADGQITNDARIKASLPTIELVLERGGLPILMSHLGRPTEGTFEDRFSLLPVCEHLSNLLGQPVRIERDWLDSIDISKGEIVLCENVRFNQGEKINDDELARKMAKLCDVFVMDAFGTAHRAQASTHGVAKYAPIACAGPLLSKELDALCKALDNPARPVVAIVGGSKVSTKLTVLEALSTKVDQLIVGGGIANTFLAAQGHPIGNSLCEPDLIEEARRLKSAAQTNGGDIPVPVDVVCGTEFSAEASAVLKAVDEVCHEDMIFDLGPKTMKKFSEVLSQAGTIIWNGPVGVFEFDQFSMGTQTLANAVAASGAFSIAGGGDTVAAIEKFGVADQVSYISTGGGAFLEFVEGRVLPAVDVLNQRASS